VAVHPLDLASAEALRLLIDRADERTLASWLMVDAYGDAGRADDWWRPAAACRDSDLDWFSDDPDVQAACVDVCGGCGVVRSCRDASRVAPDPWYGVAAGLTGAQRKAEDEAAGVRRRRGPLSDPQPRPCGCGEVTCWRMVRPGQGRTHPACRKRAQRHRQRAA
jgi:hypothetical protein